LHSLILNTCIRPSFISHLPVLKLMHSIVNVAVSSAIASASRLLQPRLCLTCRLGKLWMYEAPTMFWTLWHLVSPLIDPETKQKVVFVSSKSAISEFQKAIDPSVSGFVCFHHSVQTLCLLVIGHSCFCFVHAFECHFISCVKARSV